MDEKDKVEKPSEKKANHYVDNKQFFQAMKEWKIEVKEAEDYHKPPLDYKWWKEERTDLDVEKDSEYKGGHLG